MKHVTILMSCTFVFCIVGNIYAAESLREAFTEGTPYADVRLLYAFVYQDGLAQNANAKTARTRIGFKTDKFHDFVAVIEGEHVVYLGNDDYNDTVNGRTDHPTVADPENIQVNQAY